jgi:predicted ATP-dependent serine protease
MTRGRIVAGAQEYDYVFKLVLIGDSGVGKSCLLLRFAVRATADRARLAARARPPVLYACVAHGTEGRRLVGARQDARRSGGRRSLHTHQPAASV